MTVLITRPAPDGPALAQQLNAAGISALSQPLLHIQPGHELSVLPTCLHALQSDDFLIVISAHAADFAHNYLLSVGVSWPKNVHYIAVGHKTAATMKRHTNQPIHCPETDCDSEGVLRLPILDQVKGKRVVILRGNGGREAIYQQLLQRGAEVRYCETYRREWLPLDGQLLCQQWLCAGMDALVVTSGEQLAFLTQLVPDSAKAWFLQCQLFVPSQRIADQATRLGYRFISNVGSAANGPLFTTLSKKGTMGKSDD
ncbi:uroporphyrinogen-III synthase [Photobacterium japonica]|uniref:uroporphyrinogen-III synthase n=1 Tax=Photobacterium japonica TaxID=2910235 RepID=UPI003D1235BF